MSLSVDETHFYDTERAAVWFSIAMGERRLLRRHRGEASLVDREWKMARPTFCQLMSMAGVSCPPEGGDPRISVQTTKAQPSQDAIGRLFRRPSMERCSSPGRDRTGSCVRTSLPSTTKTS